MPTIAEMLANAQVPYLYIVGAEDYVYREIRRKLGERLHIAGHAPPNWKPPFTVGKHTTHIMVVEDDCSAPLRIHAHRLSKELSLPIFQAPARNKWTETEELLKKHGLIESPLPVALVPPPAEPPAPAPEAAPSEPAICGPGVVCPSAPPPAPTPPQPSTGSVTIGEALLAKERQRQEGAPVKPNLLSPKTLALKILKESNGRAGDRPIAEAVNGELKLKRSEAVSAYQVKQWRKDTGLPSASRGSQPADVVALLATYGVKRCAPAEAAARMNAKRKERNGTSKAKLHREAKRNGTPPNGTGGGDDFVAVLRAALEEFREKVIVPFNVQDLALRFTDGKWQSPEVERVEVRKFAGKVEL